LEGTVRRSRALPARRWTAALLAAVLAASVAAAGPAGAAAAGGPSVPLPATPPVPVTAQSMSSRAPDEASSRALHGDQPASSVPAGGGAPTATSLSPSALWEVSPQTGDFSWSYPLRVPPAPGGLQPELALSYSSSAVDGRTSATNNQASWVGDGWDLSVGYVERVYGGCSDDKDGGTTPPQVGDLCWKSDNAVAAYGSSGGMLIRDTASGGWRAKNDDGSRIERLTGAGNGDDDGEYWRITTVDGTQYFFGSRPDARSTWTVPVFGDDAGEPCHGASFDASSCPQAWRWNLDRVVDRHGNVMQYGYQPETNSYGRNHKDAAVSYVRGGTLERIDYGLAAGVTAASGRVLFSTADRCIPGSSCTFDKKDNWPDVPLTERCDTPTCKDHYAPTFWTTKRLTAVTTQVRRGDSYSDVDSWALDQQFPDPGDGEKAALWLKSIVHTGLVGGSISLPPVTFEGAKLANRVVRVDGVGPLNRYRITGIVSEAGGVTSISYAADCADGSLPADPQTNTRRCFPVRWNKPGQAERTDYFHKYVVTQVTQSDRISANPTQVTSYEYLDGAAWHYDTSEFTPAAKKSWNEYRGFGRVRIRSGAPYDPAGPITLTEQRFYRGMDGDHLPSGTRSVTVSDSEGGVRADHDWLASSGYEAATYDGDGGPVVEKTITDPVWQGPTATRGEFRAYQVNPGVERVFTALAAGGWRVTRTEHSYDDRGQPTQVNDLGDTATSADDRCTRTSYIRNTDRWLVSFPSRVQTVAVGCTGTPVFPADAISDTRASYDGQPAGAAPTTGDVTTEEQLEQRPAAGPVYYPKTRASYDAHGRMLTRTDALDHTTRTAYTPATGGPLTQTTTTNELGHTSTTTLEPAWSTPVATVDANGRKTEIAYDPLGRNAEVWQPNRPRTPGTSGTGNTRIGYLVRQDGPTVITTTSLGPNGSYTSANTLYDGLYRVRQTQAPAAGGGRLIVDTRYDSQGRQHRTTQPYFTDDPVDSTLWVAADAEVPGMTVTEYDGAGRPTASVYKGRGQERWRVTTGYGGDRLHTTPPAGGTATTAITDARGQLTALRQYHGGQPTGDYDETTYTYTSAGQPATVTDPAGSTWRYSYDLRGRPVRVDDPDKGSTTTAYDPTDHPVSVTDARGDTLAFSYDALGRQTGVYAGELGGTQLAGWTYDTAAGGKGLDASTTSWIGGNPYTTKVTAYSALSQPVVLAAVIPEAAGALAGTYQSVLKYNDDGSLKGESYPAGGGLAEESLTHTYDDAGRPLATTGGLNGETVSYVGATSYTRYGETQRVELGAGTSRAWLSYYYDDSTRRLDRSIVDAEVPRPMQADVHYDYDPAGNVTAIADTAQDRPADLQCFRYDHLRRLTEAWTPAPAASGPPAAGCAAAPATAGLAGPAPYWQSYRYDPVGNRTAEVRHAPAGDTTRTYRYPPAGSEARPHAVTSVSTAGAAGTGLDEFGYDAAGNTTSRTVGGTSQQLTWDTQGRLASVTDGTATTDFGYSADGGRLIRRDPTGTTLYLGAEELRLDRGTGQITATRYYQHGGNTVAVRTGSRLSWLAADHHGTAQVTVDAATLATATRRLDPFGNPRGDQPAWPGERGFVGGTIDPTGLTHLGARDYDPATGRFVSVDPVLDPGDPQQLNAYGYADNNPATMSDPDGQRYFVDVDGYVSVPPAYAIKSIGAARYRAILQRAQTKARRVTAQNARAKLNSPVSYKNTGKRVPKQAIDGLRTGYGYKGSDDFTYADALVFAQQGKAQAGIVCQAFGGTPDDCHAEDPFVGFLGDVFGFIYEMTPIADVQHCIDGSQSCWWLLTDIVPAGKAAKAASKAVDGAADMLHGARGARDAKAGEVGSSKATVTGGYDPKTGRVVAGCNRNPVGCAEDDVARQLGIDPKDVRFTEAIRPRTGREVPICVRCQEKYDPSQFPPGTSFDSGGRWGG
jgi:RHS repeat-associated protein